MSDFFPVLEEGVAIFFPSIGPAAPFQMREEKNVVAAPKIRRDDKGKTAGICREKKERNQMEGAVAKSYFPYSVW